MKARVLRRRSTLVPLTARYTGWPCTWMSIAGVVETMNVGAGFRTGTACAFFSAPWTARSASIRSSATDRTFAFSNASHIAEYSAFFAAAEGKFASVI